jgi:hypothetical protein
LAPVTRCPHQPARDLARQAATDKQAKRAVNVWPCAAQGDLACPAQVVRSAQVCVCLFLRVSLLFARAFCSFPSCMWSKGRALPATIVPTAAPTRRLPVAASEPTARLAVPCPSCALLVGDARILLDVSDSVLLSQADSEPRPCLPRHCAPGRALPGGLATSAKSPRSVLVPAWPDGTAFQVRQARFALECAKRATSAHREAPTHRLQPAAEGRFVRKGRQKPHRALPVRSREKDEMANRVFMYAGRFGALTTLSSAACSGSCPPGRWGVPGETNALCSGACESGRFGLAGSSTSLCSGKAQATRATSRSLTFVYRTVRCGLLVSSWIN